MYSEGEEHKHCYAVRINKLLCVTSHTEFLLSL